MTHGSSVPLLLRVDLSAGAWAGRFALFAGAPLARGLLHLSSAA